MSEQGTVRITVETRKCWREWTADIGWCHGSGKSKSAAVDDLRATVASFLESWRPPEAVSYGERTAMVWVQPGGVSYALVGSYSSCSMSGGLEDGKRAALRHLVQRETDWADEVSVWAGFDVLSFNRDSDGATEHLRSAAWQRAAAYAKDATDHDPHDWACQHAGEERFRPVRPMRAAG